MVKSKGKLIAIEGLDGSGKTTQALILTKKLEEIGIKYIFTREPSEGEIGKLISEVLKKNKQFDKRVLSSLFIADRLDHILNQNHGFLNNINSGETVICDRYYFSSYAYNSNHVSLDWLINANSLSASIAKPDLNIFIDTDPVICYERILSRQKKTELYEEIETLISVKENFFKAFKRLKNKENILIVDGNQTESRISEEIWDEVSKMY